MKSLRRHCSSLNKKGVKLTVELNSIPEITDSSWYKGEIIQKMLSGDRDFIDSIINKVIKLYDQIHPENKTQNN